MSRGKMVIVQFLSSNKASRLLCLLRMPERIINFPRGSGINSPLPVRVIDIIPPLSPNTTKRHTIYMPADETGLPGSTMPGWSGAERVVSAYLEVDNKGEIVGVRRDPGETARKQGEARRNHYGRHLVP